MIPIETPAELAEVGEGEEGVASSAGSSRRKAPRLDAEIEARIREITKVFEAAVRESFRLVDQQIADLGSKGRERIPGIRPGVDPDSLMNEEEAAKFLGVSKLTLQTWQTKKTGPVFALYENSRRCYRRRDLVAFVEAKIQSSASGR